MQAARLAVMSEHVSASVDVVTSEPSASQLRGPQYMQQQANVRLRALTLGGMDLEWYCLNDIVMGGRSSSCLKRTESGSLHFSGTIDTNGGGFASCRTAPLPIRVPSEAKGFRLKFSGLPTHAFKFTLSAGARIEGKVGCDNDTRGFVQRWEAMDAEQRQQTLERVTWQCELPIGEGDAPQEAYLPFAEFKPSLFGQKLTGLALSHEIVNHIGMNAGIFDMAGQHDSRYSGGPFELQFFSVAFASE
mmetsp:Transcript_10114/g.16559  ORF Transcript_10114/g.16559 Transcript_10114/m.16559 type:complete len:246 (-) Transcript_10114:283-1020(-)